MHLRVQSFDAAVHHLGEAGQVGHVAHGEPRLAQSPRRAARGDEVDAVRVERLREFDEACLVRDGQQSTADRNAVGGRHGVT